MGGAGSTLLLVTGIHKPLEAGKLTWRSPGESRGPGLLCNQICVWSPASGSSFLSSLLPQHVTVIQSSFCPPPQHHV